MTLRPSLCHPEYEIGRRGDRINLNHNLQKNELHEDFIDFHFIFTVPEGILSDISQVGSIRLLKDGWLEVNSRETA